MELCLFECVEDAEPRHRSALDPGLHRTGDYWHVRVEGIGPGQLDGWRVEGAWQPVSFFTPHPGYGCSCDPMAVINEFRDLVKALHRAGIEVILDVVVNHTAEGDAEGPAFCFRGLADGDYYLQNGDGTYIDVTGCGNTFNTNHPVVRRLIHHSLRHWVLDRVQTGQPTPLSPIL